MHNEYYAKTLGYWENRADGYEREEKPKIISEIIEHLKQKQTPHILDIGCGPGYNATDVLNNLDCRITCLDFSAKMIGLAKKNIREAGFADRVDFLQDNILDAQLENNSFDAVMAVSVLHYLQSCDIKKACANIHQALKLKGVLLIVEYWTKQELSEFEQKALEIVNKARQSLNGFKAVFLNDKEYFHLLKQSGFSKISKTYLEEPIYLDKYAEINPELRNEIAQLKTASDNLINITVIKARK